MQFSFTLTSDFLRKSYAKRIFKRWPLLLLSIALMLTGIYLNTKNEINTISVIGLTMIGFAILIYTAAWIRHAKYIQKWINQQGTTPVIYTLTETLISTESVMGNTSLTWNTFEKIIITEFDTLLFFSSSSALTLPTSQTPPEALHFIKEKFIASGKRVIDKRKQG